MSRADAEQLRRDYARECGKAPWGEAAAVAVLLGFRRIIGDHRFTAHVTATGVDWDAVLGASSWSSTERFLLATAAALWLGHSRTAAVDISRVSWLDDESFRVWHDMVTAARTGSIPGRPGEMTGP